MSSNTSSVKYIWKKSTGLLLSSICNFEPTCSTKFKSTCSTTSSFHWLFAGPFCSLARIFLAGGSTSSKFLTLTKFVPSPGQFLHLTNVEHNPSHQNLAALRLRLRKQLRSGCYHPNFRSFSSKLALFNEKLIKQLSQEIFYKKNGLSTCSFAKNSVKIVSKHCVTIPQACQYR